MRQREAAVARGPPVDSDGESEVDAESGVDEDAKYDIQGGDVDFWMEEDDTLNVRSTFLREMLSEKKSEGDVDGESNDTDQRVD
jgi:hypothetical protein